MTYLERENEKLRSENKVLKEKLKKAMAIPQELSNMGKNDNWPWVDTWMDKYTNSCPACIDAQFARNECVKKKQKKS